MALIVEPETF